MCSADLSPLYPAAIFFVFHLFTRVCAHSVPLLRVRCGKFHSAGLRNDDETDLMSRLVPAFCCRRGHTQKFGCREQSFMLYFTPCGQAALRFGIITDTLEKGIFITLVHFDMKRCCGRICQVKGAVCNMSRDLWTG